ncbi:MAG: cell division protein ZapA [Rubrimonas sp.]
MATVEVVVGGRPYQIGCEDGQERRIAALAAQIDQEVTAIARQVGAMNEARLLLMAAMTLADQLDEATDALAQARKAAAGGVNGEEAAALEAAVSKLESLLERHAAAGRRT